MFNKTTMRLNMFSVMLICRLNNQTKNKPLECVMLIKLSPVNSTQF